MSYEEFEEVMKIVKRFSKELKYTEGASAADFMCLLYCTLESHFWKKKNDPEKGKKDIEDFYKHMAQLKDMLNRDKCIPNE